MLAWHYEAYAGFEPIALLFVETGMLFLSAEPWLVDYDLGKPA